MDKKTLIILVVILAVLIVAGVFIYNYFETQKEALANQNQPVKEQKTIGGYLVDALMGLINPASLAGKK